MHALISKFDDKIGIVTFLYYILVGGSSAVVSFVSFLILQRELAHFNYQIPVTLSYIIAITFRFFCNRHITFKSTDSYLASQVFRYLVMILINYILTIVTVHAVVQWFFLSPSLGMITSIVVTAFTGFALSKFWVYKAS